MTGKLKLKRKLKINQNENHTDSTVSLPFYQKATTKSTFIKHSSSVEA